MMLERYIIEWTLMTSERGKSAVDATLWTVILTLKGRCMSYHQLLEKERRDGDDDVDDDDADDDHRLVYPTGNMRCSILISIHWLMLMCIITSGRGGKIWRKGESFSYHRHQMWLRSHLIIHTCPLIPIRIDPTTVSLHSMAAVRRVTSCHGWLPCP